jgi:hypothetical protein
MRFFWKAKCFQMGKGMTTMIILSGVAERTPTHSDQPWIHVRIQLIARIRTGLAIFAAVQSHAALAERQNCSLNNAVGA